MPVSGLTEQRSSALERGRVAPTTATLAPSEEPIAAAATPEPTELARLPVDAAAQAGARRRVADGDPLVAARRAASASGVPGSSAPALPPDYGSLQKLAAQLPKLDPRFSAVTPEGRATMALALAIGGTEVYGKGTTGTDFFTRRGGTRNNMRGFAQFNLAYHSRTTSTPANYAKLVAGILNGATPMPNSTPGSNHAAALADAVASGKVTDGAGLRRFMEARGFGGSNWQGIDDGWSRVPGLADALVAHVRGGGG